MAGTASDGPEAGSRRPGAWLAEDHALLCRAVREAGAIASGFFARGVTGWDKRPGSPVSEADIAADVLLREKLIGARPGYGWLSEESGESDNRLAAERLWIVDPIDGTRGFLRGDREYAVSVALVVDGAPVAAAVFNPETDEFFEATVGGGARLNGAPIRVAARQDIAGMKLLVSRRELRSIRPLAESWGCEVGAISSIAFKIALVAAGRVDAVLSRIGKSDWDIAGGHLIVTEAGGRITSQDGSRLSFNRPRPRHDSVVAANPALHAALVERLGRC